MKIYIAHNWAAREWLRAEVVPKLWALDHEVTSRWLLEVDHGSNGKGSEALKDWMDVNASDALLFCADQFGDTPGQGKFIEFGIALQAGKKIFILGENDRCVFFHLKGITRIKDLEEIRASY